MSYPIALGAALYYSRRARTAPIRQIVTAIKWARIAITAELLAGLTYVLSGERGVEPVVMLTLAAFNVSLCTWMIRILTRHVNAPRPPLASWDSPR